MGRQKSRRGISLHIDFYGKFSELIASSPRQGFETQIRFQGFAKHVVLVALDINAKELGRSNITDTEVPPDLQSLSIAHKESQWVENARNQSLYWEVPSQEAKSSFWSDFEWFTMGVLFCVLILCNIVFMVFRRSGMLKPRRELWWRIGQRKYSAIAPSDGALEQSEMMLHKTGANEY